METCLFTDARLATMAEPGSEFGSGAPYGMIENGMLAVADRTIVWAGPAGVIPASLRSFPRQSLEGRLVTPAPIDCHTHIVAGGNRAGEFELRLKGASYEEVSKAGGGIVSTVKATRAASEDVLLAGALTRVDALIAEGVCLIEIKSGYGLDIETELKMLRVARRIQELRPVRIETSFLGAHALPAEFSGRADAYIDEICIPALDAAHAQGLVDAVDGFCEGIGFTPAQITRVFDRAEALGLPVKLHAEQLSNLNGAALAAGYGALSADHLEYLDHAGVDAMAAAGSVAVLLPGAFYTLRETRVPPVAALRAAGVPIAIATDCNPGSSPLTSLLLTMNMACTLFRLTPEEALTGVTRTAAMALGRDDCGRIAAGLRADLTIWDVEHPAELAYRIGFNPLHKRIFGGTQ